MVSKNTVFPVNFRPSKTYRGVRSPLRLRNGNARSQVDFGSQARGRLKLCAGSARWPGGVRRDRDGTLGSASLCQTEVQRCLIWLRSLFVQAVSGILTDLRRNPLLFFFPFAIFLLMSVLYLHTWRYTAGPHVPSQGRRPRLTGTEARLVPAHLLLFAGPVQRGLCQSGCWGPGRLPTSCT